MEKNNLNQRKKIALIGGGIAGISAAQLLHKHHDVVLFEKANYVGGHTNTIQIQNGQDAGTWVDTGFIVCNNWTYPTLHKFFKAIDIKVRDTCMSFGYHCEETGFQYAGTNLNGLIAQRENIINPRLWKITRDMLQFNKKTKALFDAKKVPTGTVGEYCRELNLSPEFIQDYLLPIGAAIWSTPNKGIEDFPADLFLRFFVNHGLLNVLDKPQWQTVWGGSQKYVKAFLAQFLGIIRLNSQIQSVERGEDFAKVHLQDGSSEQFDAVIFSCHADQVLALLQNPTPEEIAAFSPWNYLPNHTILHTDTKIMPPNKRAWASWNFAREKSHNGINPISLTYDMNRLQGLNTREHYLVTLNRQGEVNPKKIITEISYDHPNFTPETEVTRALILELNGQNNTYFTGSYMGFGFHEDACKSSFDLVKRHFGLSEY